MYKHCDISDKYVSLHDCHASNILYENGVMTFIFPNGIWIFTVEALESSKLYNLLMPIFNNIKIF